MQTSLFQINTEGDATLGAGTRKLPWVSLDGVVFSVVSSARLLLPDDYLATSDARPPSYQRVEIGTTSVCVVSGAVTGTGKTLIATIPAECRPKTNLLFTVNNRAAVLRLQVRPDGEIHRIEGPEPTSATPLSFTLDGIRIVVRVAL